MDLVKSEQAKGLLLEKNEMMVMKMMRMITTTTALLDYKSM
jgi:hypothetical protein